MTRSILINALAFLAATGCAPDVYNEYDIDVFVESPEDTATDTGDTGTDEPTVVTYHVPDIGNQVHETTTRLEFVSGEHYTIETDTNPVGLDCLVVTLRVPENASQGAIVKRVWYGGVASDFNGTDWFHGLEPVGTGSNVMILGDLQMFRDPDQIAGTELYYSPYLFNSGEAIYWRTLVSLEWGEQAMRMETDYFAPIGSEFGIGFCMGWNPYNPWGEPYDVYGEPSETDMVSAVLGNIHWTPADNRDFESIAIHGLTTPVMAGAFDE